MSVSWDVVKRRLSARGSGGRLKSAITDDESEEELRDLLIKFSENCPLNRQHCFCPFCVLGGLYHATLKNLVREMTRPQLAGLFELECDLRNAKDHPCVAQNSELGNPDKPVCNQ